MEIEKISKIDKNQTGLASEFFVAAELFRRKWNVTLSFGNTKKFDLLAMKGEQKVSIQVKGIDSTKSGNWNIKKTDSLSTDDTLIVFVNLNNNQLNTSPEYFVLTSPEAHELIINTNKKGDLIKRDYLSYKTLKKKSDEFQDKWDKLEHKKTPNEINQ